MEKLLLGILLIIIVNISWGGVNDNRYISTPMLHSNQIVGRTWKNEVKHNNKPALVNCLSKESNFSSQCVFELREGEHLPENVEFVDLAIKTKSWTRNVGHQHDSYALIYARVKARENYSDHIIHTEVWSPEISFKDRRRISYAYITVPVHNGKVIISVGKQISGFAQVDIGIYLNGYKLGGK